VAKLAASGITRDDQGDWQAQAQVGTSTSAQIPHFDNQEDSDNAQASSVGQLADTGTDVFVENWQAQRVTLPSHGALSLERDGSFTYTAAANFQGTDQFAYRIVAGDLQSTQATVTITVGPRVSVIMRGRMTSRPSWRSCSRRRPGVLYTRPGGAGMWMQCRARTKTRKFAQ
jgi:VCBS repeat-containing protein